MDDQLIINQRRYKEFHSSVIDDLTPYLRPDRDNPQPLGMTRTGVTVDDDEMITITTGGRTIISFRVDQNIRVRKTFIFPLAFMGPFSVFYQRDRKLITEYIESFIGTQLIFE